MPARGSFSGSRSDRCEVKVALSDPFGRFVARAYLERYFNLSIFAHLGSRTIDLDPRKHVKVARLSPGDLPDWIRGGAVLAVAPSRYERRFDIANGNLDR